MNAMNLDAGRIAAFVRTLPEWSEAQLRVEPALPVLASPSWRGVDGAPWRVEGGPATLFVKAMDPDAALTIDVPAAFEAARRAGAIGVGPAVHLADAEVGLLVMEHLGEGWRTAGLEDMLDPAIVDAALAARRRFQAEAGPLPREEDVFGAIEALHAHCLAAGADLPPDARFLLENAALARDGVSAAATGMERMPILADGNVSNLMIGPGGEVRLVDYDRAGDGDPLADLGFFLTEAFAFEAEAREAFARACGGFDERAFNRARLYGVADDLRWGLQGTLLAKVSPRVTTEFQKYANWRFLRARMAIRDPRFCERLRRL